MPAHTTSKLGLGREASLRVRIWPEYPERYLNEIIWASKPDCGISTTRKASPNLRHCQAPPHRTKDRTEMAGCRPSPSGDRQPEPEGGIRSPRETLSTKL